MNKKIKNFRNYIISDFVKDSQGLNIKDKIYENMSSCTECQKIFKYADWKWTDENGKVKKNKVCLVDDTYDLDEITGDVEYILRGEAVCPHCGSEFVFATTELDAKNGFDVKEVGDNHGRN